MAENDFETRLGPLLRQTANDIPSDADVTPRVHSRLYAPSRQWLPRWSGAAASMVVVVALLVGTLAFFQSHGAAPVDANQIVLHVDGVDANATLTVVRYHFTAPASFIYSPLDDTLFDALGNSYFDMSGSGSSQGGQIADFGPLPPEALQGRQTLTMTIHMIAVMSKTLTPEHVNATDTVVSGSWRVSFDVTPVPGTSVSLNSAAQTHSGLTIQALRADVAPNSANLPEGLRVVVKLSGLTPGTLPSFDTSNNSPEGGPTESACPGASGGTSSPNDGQVLLSNGDGTQLQPAFVIQLTAAGATTGLTPVPLDGTAELELIFCVQLQAPVALTFGPVPAATAGGASHVIAGPWVFPLPVG